MRLPTYCGPPYTTTVTAQAWNGAVATATHTTPTGATGCDQVPFSPSLSIYAVDHAARQPGRSGRHGQPPDVPDPAQIGQSHVRTPR